MSRAHPWWISIPWEAMRLTVGPLPPAVYWRRRAIVLGAALLVLFLIAQACMASAPARDRTGPGPTPSGSPAGSPLPPVPTTSAAVPPAAGEDAEDTEDDGAAPGPEECTDDEISLTAAASRTSFGVGEQVQFTIRIAHAAERTCQRDVGGDLRELYLVRGAGAEHVWSSRDCANPTGSEVVELTEDWEREHHIGFTGQSTSRCTGPAAAGPDLEPGDYQLRARLGTARSGPVTITLT